MTGVPAWLDANWFTLVQSIGIIASILLTAATMRRDRRSRRISDHLALTTEHRELWADLHKRPDLTRVVSSEVDLLAEPLSTAEEEFLLLVIVHFHTGWLLAKQGSLVDLGVLAQDAGAFFRLPLPKMVWLRTRAIRDPAFVGFIDAACAKPKRRRHACRRLFRRTERKLVRMVSKTLGNARQRVFRAQGWLTRQARRVISHLRIWPSRHRLW
jgi:hypothetical protein